MEMVQTGAQEGRKGGRNGGEQITKWCITKLAAAFNECSPSSVLCDVSRKIYWGLE